MDLAPTRSLLDKNLDQLLAKASDPKATLNALAKKIAVTKAEVEAYVTALELRATELPDLLGEEDKAIAKVQAVIAKARQDGRADLAQAAKARLAKNEEKRETLQQESDANDAQRAEAEDLLVKLEERLMTVEEKAVDFGGLDPAGTAAPETAPEPAPAPTAQAPKPTATPLGAKKKSGGSLDDEFAALLSEMNVDLAKVELPKKPSAKLQPPPKEDDLGLPELVTVKDDELPEGEELEALPPAKGSKAAPQAAAKPVAPAAKAPAKPGAAPTAPATTPADEPKKKSKLWLWVTVGAAAIGGGGLAIAHFALGLF